ncbi:UDP-3-O-acyl-N-acetylglucosamine deacetylase [Candidatus Nitronereus thalassa]|uniref:UDP-3-O-acyl-N-acetylglucosamine deacetylase n=1 Tax=Candidatus Nitronereus thalassa TaxID=3020898 RepID=A0ABU3K6Q1_9BACT|nr:UDP-3-O-acyl-N-acetylglucosamine deacetylase [Candidatus Nitronereus thalassa]MDT7042119.1 UDP-3-O-acyl-N-acetylglucosamine deacetylase [Candidatus Nitronereus thalassa]
MQRTLRQPTALEGIGLHSGKPSKVTLSPAPVDSGIVFRRKTNGHLESCQASIRNLRPMELCTTIGSNGFQIQTTEHVLSALWGMQIDNAYIDINSEEVPAMDGSASPFVEMIHTAGIVSQERPRSFLKIIKPLHIGDHRRGVSVLPSVTPKITYSIDYNHALIQQQTYEYEWSPASFQDRIAEARTFAFSHEVEALWARGLGQGGSLDNTIVFSESGILNDQGLRFPDECVRHKVLDLIGDLALLGLPIIGHIIADRSGHFLHNQLIQMILDNSDAWILVGSHHPGWDNSSDGYSNENDMAHSVSLSANSAA